MALDPNFRIAAFQEARECFRLVKEMDIEQPEFWANLLGAIANGVMASVPDSVVAGALAQEAQRVEKQKAARKHLKAALDAQ